MSGRTGLSIEHLDVSYSGVPAIEDVTLTVRPGSVLGIVGESGSGKSTLAHAIMSTLPSAGAITGGRIDFDGAPLSVLSERELRPLRWTQISMVFQNALEALNPVFSIGYQIEDTLRRRAGLDKAAARATAAELLPEVGLAPRLLGAYPHELSGGMRQRVMIALALACRPSLVIADEPTTALDVVAQEGIVELLQKLRQDLGMTLVVISHDLGLITRLCDEVAVMYAGRLVEHGSSDDILSRPRHPYTRALIGAYPRVSGPLEAIVPLEGDPPAIGQMPQGCRFHPRCPVAIDLCSREEPARRGTLDHWSACHLDPGTSLQ